MKQSLMIFMVAILAVATLTACGRKGAPDSPPGSTYPSDYPSK